MALKYEFEDQGNWLFRYRSFIPIGLLGTALIVLIVENQQDAVPKNCSIWIELSFLIVSLFGLGIRIYTVGHSAKRTSGRNTQEGQVADSLNTSGAYSIVRHPLYLGNFFMWLGPALLTSNLWFIISFVLFYCIYYERIMFAEEQFLERKFGAQYTEWASRVPAFIPNIKRFKQSHLNFSLRKVLKKEKNGLFAIFLVFTFFDIVGEIVSNHSHYNRVFIAGAIITMILYVVLKILKKSAVLQDNR